MDNKVKATIRILSVVLMMLFSQLGCSGESGSLSEKTALSSETSFGKVGYVNIQKAIEETPAGKKAKKKLRKFLKKKETEMKKREKKIQAMIKGFEKKRKLMSPAGLQSRQVEIQKATLQYQKDLQKTQLELQKKERELALPIRKKIQKAINKIANKEGYSLIMDASPLTTNLIWGSPKLDLTKKVLKMIK